MGGPRRAVPTLLGLGDRHVRHGRAHRARPGATVAGSTRGWLALGDEHRDGAPRAGEAPPVDFRCKVVVAVALPGRAHSCSALTVLGWSSDAEDRTARVVVQEVHSPRQGCGDVAAAPFVVANVPREQPRVLVEVRAQDATTLHGPYA